MRSTSTPVWPILLTIFVLGCSDKRAVEGPDIVGPLDVCALDPAFFKEASTSPVAGSVVDLRDGQTYPYVALGGLHWFSTNLRFKPASLETWCPGNSETGCRYLGRLYDWWGATGQSKQCLDASCPAWDAPIGRGACPEGWRVPKAADFAALVAATGGTALAGEKLKAKSGWLPDPSGKAGTGTDEFGFNALPSGARSPGDGTAKGDCSGLGVQAALWTSERRTSLFEPTLSIWMVLASGTTEVAEYSVASPAAAAIRCVREIP